MSRYLTPRRICLLVLTEVYLAGHAPANDDAGLKVLAFITQHIVVPQESAEGGNGCNDYAEPSPDLEGFADELRQCSSDLPGHSIYDALVSRLWAFSGVDSLTMLFGWFEQIANPEEALLPSSMPVRVSRASPLGQFVRRCCIEFTRLQFSEVLTLWQALKTYRAPSYEEFAAHNPGEELQDVGDGTAGQLEVSGEEGSASNGDDGLALCMMDAENMLTQSVRQLQRFGQRVPGSMKARLELWIAGQEDAGPLSLRFFVAFFEHWRAGQYSMALDSVHRYFDYSLAARTAADSIRAYYQYALLHLSILHADFECWEESIDAMSECIGTARENQDTACLNFALSWLLYLRHADPRALQSSVGISHSGDADEVAFLKASAREGKQWLLLSSTLLEEAKLELCSAHPMSRAQEHILQSMYLNSQHDLRLSMPAASMLYGATLERLGQTHVALRTHQAINLIHAHQCPLHERVKSACRVAYLMSARAEFAEAFAVLAELMPDVERTPKQHNHVAAYRLLIQFRECLQRRETDDALELLPQLNAIQLLDDEELSFEAKSLAFELVVQSGVSSSDNLAHICDWIAELDRADADLAQRLYVRVLKARFVAATSCTASKTLTNTLRILTTAELHLFLPVLRDALLLLAEILDEQAEQDAAAQLRDAIAPLLLETGEHALR